MSTLGGERPPVTVAVGQEEIEAVLKVGSCTVAWQPIVDLATREVLGYEALARFGGIDDADVTSATEWFSAASFAGVRDRLELLAVSSAFAEFQRLPETVFVSINVSPATVTSAAFEELLGAVPGERLVLEISEAAVAYAETEEVLAVLERLRKEGMRVALDDTGSGPASLRQLLGIDPDIIKIDTDIVHGIDEDEMRQAIAYALASLADRAGAISLAEGVETEGEAEMLTSLGVKAAQGFLFGRPAELSSYDDSEGAA